MNKSSIDAHRVVDMYVSGESENSIAKRLGVSRTPIRRILVESGVSIRGRSDAERLKWSKMNAQQRANQVSNAHQSIREKPRSFFASAAIKQATSKERSLAKVGDLEDIFAGYIAGTGREITPQKAFGPYNIDIATGFAAIEIHGNTNNPHSHAYYRKRVVKLMEGGWHVICIKTAGKVIFESAAQKVGAMLDLIESDKTGIRHYGVVSGSGKLIATGSLDGDKLSVVSASDGFFAGIV